jgi:hypothetical protein
MISEAILLEIHDMNDPGNAILPAEAMHDVDERNIEVAEAICKGDERKQEKRQGRSLERQQRKRAYTSREKKKKSTTQSSP